MVSPKRWIYSGPYVVKISLTVLMAEPPHGVVDDFVGVFGALLGEVEVDHGGLQSTVAHIALNDPGVDPFFQEVCGVAVSQGVNRHTPLRDTR